MATLSVQSEILRHVAALPEPKQRQVLDYVRDLAMNGRPGEPGSQLLQYVGLLPAEDLAEMKQIIESECERIDARDW